MYNEPRPLSSVWASPKSVITSQQRLPFGFIWEFRLIASDLFFYEIQKCGHLAVQPVIAIISLSYPSSRQKCLRPAWARRQWPHLYFALTFFFPDYRAAAKGCGVQWVYSVEGDNHSHNLLTTKVSCSVPLSHIFCWTLRHNFVVENGFGWHHKDESRIPLLCHPRDILNDC